VPKVAHLMPAAESGNPTDTLSTPLRRDAWPWKPIRGLYRGSAKNRPEVAPHPTTRAPGGRIEP
jgi:hypothetical protein